MRKEIPLVTPPPHIMEALKAAKANKAKDIERGRQIMIERGLLPANGKP